MNFIAILVAALVPMLVGFIWYHPKVVGNAWMKETGLTEEKMKGVNMPLIFGLSFVFALMLSMSMQMLVIHQMHVGSLLQHHQDELKDPSSAVGALFKTMMDNYGNEFRTFKHGAFHGFISSLFIVLPLVATNGMFERKSWKYIWIIWGYWALTFTIMGGIICAWQ
ncbi:MAG: DUF1761 domain-containing protein [Phycisphaerales bacterium]|nr:DUF1761 domain-containing protein [Phycisphaerales bacterium]